MQGSVYWTPVIEGETLTTEIYISPGLTPNSFVFDLPEISHLVSTASRASIKSSGIGSSDPCEHDVACISNPTQAFLNTAKAVAKMIFNDGAGSFLCTGTLLNDTVTTSFIPYFYTGFFTGGLIYILISYYTSENNFWYEIPIASLFILLYFLTVRENFKWKIPLVAFLASLASMIKPTA